MIPALNKWWVRFGLAVALLATAIVTSALVARDRSSDIVLFTTVMGWDIASADKRIDVASDTVAVGVDKWIVSFKVDSVVNGDFTFDEVNVLVHSPSQFGVQAPGDRFVVHLRRRATGIRTIGSSNGALSRGLAQLSFAERTYESLAIIRRP